MKQKILTALALVLAFVASATAAISLPSAGKVGFLWAGEEGQLQEKAAKDFFKENYGEANLITEASDITLDKFSCIWVHIDRKGLAIGWENLPDFFRSNEMIGALKEYLAAGGNLYLSGHATQLLVGIERIGSADAPKTFGSGDGGGGTDQWTVNAFFANQDNRKHPIFKGLQTSNAFDYETFGLLYGGGPQILREDHNCLWDHDAKSVADFQKTTNSRALGAWGQIKNETNSYGIVEFYPQNETQGTVIANGLAACQWYMHNSDTNVYADNIRLLTGNVLSYLAPADGSQPNKFNPGLLFSSKKVALFVGYKDQTSLGAADNREGKAIYNFFKSIYPNNVLYVEDIDRISRDEFDCVWVHIDRPGVSVADDGNIIGLPTNFPLEELVGALKTFHEEGGNIYLSKQAVCLINKINSACPVPNRNTYEVAKEYEDIWYANIQHNDLDFTQHPIFQNINHVDNLGVKMIEIASGVTTREDNTSMWYMNGTLGDVPTHLSDNHTDFCSKYHATVLATWGHNLDDAPRFAGIIEFRPPVNAPQNARRKTKTGTPKSERRSLIVANGMGGYEWAPKVGTNESLDQIQQLSANILAYLSPADEELEEQTVTVTMVNTSSDGNISAPFSPTGTVTLSLGITFNNAIDPSDFNVTVKPENVANWPTFTGDKDEMEVKYKSVLNDPTSVFDQWMGLGGKEAIVDGFYNGDEYLPGTLTATESSDTDYAYDINVDVPCSGIYTLTVAPNTGSNVTLTNPEAVSGIKVEIYPNLFGEFGEDDVEYTYTNPEGEEENAVSHKEMGFNINGYSYNEVDSDIAIIYMPEEMWTLKKAIGYFPGTYFVKSINVVSSSVAAEEVSSGHTPDDITSDAMMAKRRVEDSDGESLPNIYWTQPIDISDLNAQAGTKEVTLNVTAEKNGASHTFTFTVARSVSDDDLNAPTGVETVGFEDGEAAYYNLQGIQVKNPKQGIYLKVINGKTSKVVIR